MLRRLHHLRSISVREALTFIHALVVMGVVEILVRFVRLPRVARLVGAPLSLDTTEPKPFDPAVFDNMPIAMRRKLWCTDRVAVRWPFSKGPCLRRALVGGHLIRRHGPTIRLGVDVSAADAEAHAWLEIDGEPLEDTTDIVTFTSRGDDA